MEMGILENFFFNLRLVLIQSLSCIMPFCRCKNQYDQAVSRGTQKNDSKTNCSQFDQIVNSIYGDIEQIGVAMPYECQRSRYPIKKQPKNHRSVFMDGIVNMSQVHFDINGNRHLFAKSVLSMDLGPTDATTSPNLSLRKNDDVKLCLSNHRGRLNVAERDYNSSTDDFRYQYPDRIKRPHVNFTLNSPDEDESLSLNNNRTINRCDSSCPSPSDETLTPHPNKTSKFDYYVSPTDSKLSTRRATPVNIKPSCYCDHCISPSEKMKNKKHASVNSNISFNSSDDSNKFQENPTRKVEIRETKYNYNCFTPSMSSPQNSSTHVHPINKEVKYANDIYGNNFSSTSSDEVNKYLQTYPCKEVTYDGRNFNSYNSYYNSPTTVKENSCCIPPSCKHNYSSSSRPIHKHFDFNGESDDDMYRENERRRNSYERDYPSPISGILTKKTYHRSFKEVRIRDENDSYLNSPQKGCQHSPPNTVANEKGFPHTPPNIVAGRMDFKIDSSSNTSDDDKDYHILTQANSRQFQKKLEKITKNQSYKSPKCSCDHMKYNSPTLINTGTECDIFNNKEPKCVCYKMCNCSHDPNNCQCPSNRLKKMININNKRMEQRNRVEHIHNTSSCLCHHIEENYTLCENESTDLTMDDNHSSTENLPDKKITSPDRYIVKKSASFSLSTSSLNERRSVGCPKSASYMSACNSCVSPDRQDGYKYTNIPNCVINHLVDHNVAFHVVKLWDDNY